MTNQIKSFIIRLVFVRARDAVTNASTRLILFLLSITTRRQVSWKMCFISCAAAVLPWLTRVLILKVPRNVHSHKSKTQIPSTFYLILFFKTDLLLNSKNERRAVITMLCGQRSITTHIPKFNQQ